MNGRTNKGRAEGAVTGESDSALADGDRTTLITGREWAAHV
jgi:hypothetical protein